MHDIKINTETINLDQFLKWANIVESGGQAKNLIQAGEVRVNGEVNYSRSKTIKPGDFVSLKESNDKFKVSSD
ncbi:RNA-binding S4 domain-containing protein [Halarsenatibacter silvermanii]|uniref:RNA-binding S4 domain-containing protein n=1 Tax=Halarsenatibacter silvermanii TaxID=321763 RepID=UPI000B7F897F|nr:RNA-binding S4 domain-containing protein [Halarsenatibacter silvermanii]